MTPVTVYLKAERKIEPQGDTVFIRDFGKISCQDQVISSRINALPVMKKSDSPDQKICCVSVLKLIEVITSDLPLTEIVSVGETDTIVCLYRTKQAGKLLNFLLILFVCLISFFGTSFTIMAFHNDIGIVKVFEAVYELFTKDDYPGFSILEISYSIGLCFGIILFFNHIFGHKITKDPTPVEVEMRLYENDVNTTLTESLSREGKCIDVE